MDQEQRATARRPRTREPRIATTVLLRQEHLEQLREAADRASCSVSLLARRAIERYLQQEHDL